MREAVRLARRGFPAPNPHVGAVVARGLEVVGRGYHAYAGGPHAEVVALQKAGPRARGATLYVTLEPCNHHGRTPPCTEAILRSGVRRVVVATRDPNRNVAAGGLRRLRGAGLEVEVGLLKGRAEEANRHFLKFHRTGLPWVSLKAAMSLDGKIATAAGDSKWITDEAARSYAHRLRADHGAVLVGSGTVARDDPLLTARARGVRNQPLRVVLDGRLRTPVRARIFGPDAKTVVFHVGGAAGRAQALEARGVRVVRVPAEGDRAALPAVLEHLAEWGITGLLVEGGGEVLAGFLSSGLADSVHLFYAPVLLGGRTAKTAVEGEGVPRVADAWRLADAHVRKMGDGWLVEGRLAERKG
jgi:diaminohydroxyphosphoribosylaminopyrimidine deaminase/5-amino-6-(5-phosphoribosylamino)uracil reductase